MDTLYTLMPLILLIVIMYFLLIRPQKKREKQVSAMRNSIKAGDEIVTIGGIYGTVVKVREERLVIQVGADKTKLEIARWSVSKIVSDETEVPRAAKAKKTVDEDVEEVSSEQKKSRPKKLEKASTVSENESTPKDAIVVEEEDTKPVE